MCGILLNTLFLSAWSDYVLNAVLNVNTCSLKYIQNTEVHSTTFIMRKIVFLNYHYFIILV